MSVIFDALKKFNTNKQDLDQQESTADPVQGNVIIFSDLLKKKALVSYGIIGIIGCSIGVWLYFLAQFEVSSRPITPVAPIGQSASGNTEEVQAEITQRPPPVAHANAQEPAGEIIVSHIRPEQSEVGQFPVNTNAEDTTLLFATGNKNHEIAPQTTVMPQESQAHTPQPPSPPTFRTPQEEPQATPIFIPEGNSEETFSPPSAPAQKTEQHHPISSENDHDVIVTVSTTPEQTTDQTDFSSAIHVLNEELHQAIAEQNYQSSHDILAELEGLLDPNSNYILNLKAYLHLKNNELDKAHAILSAILENDNTELEAGLNMIVVLSQQGELKKARRHITFLLDYYPANQSLLHFQQQLGQ